MNRTTSSNPRCSALHRWRVMPWKVLCWPLGAACLSGVIWGGVELLLASEKSQTRKDALRDVASLSRSYSEQINRAIDQVDQIALNLKFHWQHMPASVNLEKQLKAGLYGTAALFYVTILDRNGKVATSTLQNPLTNNISQNPFFTARKADPDPELIMARPDIGPRSGKLVVRFTRRLETAEGLFNGLVVIGVQPAFFAALHDESGMGRSDFFALWKEGDTPIAMKSGAGAQPLGSVFNKAPSFMQDEGSVRMPGTAFVDNEARLVAWHRLHRHGLATVIGVSERDAMAAYRAMASTYRKAATGGTILLLLCSLVGAGMAHRHAARKRQTDEITRTYLLAIEGAQEGFYTVRALFDSDGLAIDFLVEDCNERGAALAGFSRDQMVGARFSSLYSGRAAERVLATLRHAMANGFHEDEVRMQRRSDQSVYWLHRRLVRSGTGLAVTVRDITEVKHHQLQLHALANTDDLTKLPNRHCFMTTLPQALQSAQNSGQALAVMFMDLDGFKLINDTLGHYAGDTLLQLAAARLTAAVRPHDHVARLGGDEFAVLLGHFGGEQEVRDIATRITDEFRQPFLVAGRSNLVTTSIGISLFPRDGSDSETLLKKADDAMYSIKTERSGGFRLYDERVYHAIRRRLDIERDLAAALVQDQFVMMYQPRIDTWSGQLLGMEALVRWKHPERGMIAPDEFIPVAENTGQILALGRLVIEKVCTQVAQWKAEALPIVPVSINISPRQFNQGNLQELLSGQLARQGISAECIEVEITESAMMGDSSDVVMEVNAIRSLGIKVMIDDFGTGYSSLSLLHRLDLDVLKVDKSFTAQLADSMDGAIFFKAIVSMAQSLNIRVVAEGVETIDQLEILRSLSCDEVQGYLFSRPLAADAVPEILRRRLLLPQAAAPVQA